MSLKDFERYLGESRPHEAFRWLYLDRLWFSPDVKRSVGKAGEIIADSSVVTTKGEGRSGEVAHLISHMWSDVSGSSRDIRFASEAGAMNPERLGVPDAVSVGISTSGETSEVVKWAEEMKKCGNYLIAFTSNRGSSLAHLSDLIVDTTSNSNSKEGADSVRSGSYEERQLIPHTRLVHPGYHTMGDPSEEKALLGGYAIACGLLGEKTSPNKPIGYLRQWFQDEKKVEMYNALAKAIYHYGTEDDAGQVIITGVGPSRHVGGMIINRASHYRINIKGSFADDPPKMHANKMLLALSSSARKENSNILREVRRKTRAELYGRTIEPYFFAVTGTYADWLGDCDAYIVVGSSRTRDYQFVRELEDPELFYVVTPILLNSVLRTVANYLNIPEAGARFLHTNLPG